MKKKEKGGRGGRRRRKREGRGSSGGILPNSFYEAKHYSDTKAILGQHKKRKLQANSLMSTDTKILNKYQQTEFTSILEESYIKIK